MKTYHTCERKIIPAFGFGTWLETIDDESCAYFTRRHLIGCLLVIHSYMVVSEEMMAMIKEEADKIPASPVICN